MGKSARAVRAEQPHSASGQAERGRVEGAGNHCVPAAEPAFTLSADGTQIVPDKGVWRPLAGTFESPSVRYLHERQRKRELRLESAKKGTLIAESSHTDLERTLLFDLRSAFVSTLQAKAVLQLAKDDLAYYDQVLQISRTRFNAGDIAANRSRPVGTAAGAV